jgi:hypothetical protein
MVRMPVEEGIGPGAKTGKEEKKREAKGKGGIPKAGASIRFDNMDVEKLVSVLRKGFRAHHFMCFAQRRVAVFEKEGEIEVLYHGDRVLNSIKYREGEVDLTTDIRSVPPKAMGRLDVNNLGESLKGLAQRLDAYKALLHHNEISWLLQTVIISLGASVSETELEFRLKNLPVKAYGPTCPWCGTSVAAQRDKCRFCGKDVPPEVAADDFIRRHLKRQFNDKVIGLRSLRREGEISPEAYRESKSRLDALLESVDKVSWGGPAPRT